ncbi:hypothetical protein [Neorhodopirellula lusitana]|uniref:hypothetical protein n=1 Tax=Neorhodopirellula lusitana TaxID=445327 RepID=UPI00384C2382
MTTDDITQRFSLPEITKTARVLDRIQPTPEQRSQYELRLKAQRDELARIEQVRVAGEARGEATGQIKTLRELLGIHATANDDLILEQLATISNDLQRHLRERGH